MEAQVAKLLLQDAQGHWWQIGVESGEWYMHDGEKWNKAKPPIAPAAPAAAPPPADSGPKVDGGTAQRDTRESVAPAPQKRVAPASRDNNKGSPTSMWIGTIAVIVILIVVCGCFVISNMLGGSLTAHATTTPTRSLALLPTVTLAVPLDTPTIQVTATEAVTPTLTEAKPTATRKTATPTPAGPTATATVNVPPGVYVTNIETIPAQANIGDTIGFKVSFLNTTGSIQTYNWLVKVYECPVQCEDFKHSHGETLTMNSNLAPGTSALSTSQNIDLKAGISCDLIAIANYVDPVNQLPTPFQATKNDGHFSFTPCH